MRVLTSRVMPGWIFPSLERATHSLVHRRDRVWAVTVAVEWGVVRVEGGDISTSAKGTSGVEREGTKAV